MKNVKLFVMILLSGLYCQALTQKEYHLYSNRLGKSVAWIGAYGAARGLLGHVQLKLEQGTPLAGINDWQSVSRVFDHVEACSLPALYTSAAMRIVKRAAWIGGVGMAAGQALDNKMLKEVSYTLPLAAIPTAVGIWGLRYMPGFEKVSKLISNNFWLETAAWGLGAYAWEANKNIMRQQNSNK